MPERVQFRRVKGFKLPENCVRVTRPGQFGNPFKVGQVPPHSLGFGRMDSIAEVLAIYEEYIKAQLNEDPAWLEPLRGKDLACFCSLDAECHADLLLKYANK